MFEEILFKILRFACDTELEITVRKMAAFFF